MWLTERPEARKLQLEKQFRRSEKQNWRHQNLIAGTAVFFARLAYRTSVDNEQRQLRAYVGIFDIGADTATTRDMLKVSLSIKNFGLTPANDPYIRGSVHEVPCDPTEKFRDLTKSHPRLSLPVTAFPAVPVSVVGDGKDCLVAYGELHYKDVFQKVMAKVVASIGLRSFLGCDPARATTKMKRTTKQVSIDGRKGEAAPSRLLNQALPWIGGHLRLIPHLTSNGFQRLCL